MVFPTPNILHSAEIVPPDAPLLLFVWSASRVVPVRVTDFSIVEEAFDVALNPMMADRYPFSRLSGPANVLIMPGLQSAAR